MSMLEEGKSCRRIRHSTLVRERFSTSLKPSSVTTVEIIGHGRIISSKSGMSDLLQWLQWCFFPPEVAVCKGSILFF